jgi:hypothetical protein
MNDHRTSVLPALAALALVTAGCSFLGAATPAASTGSGATTGPGATSAESATASPAAGTAASPTEAPVSSPTAPPIATPTPTASPVAAIPLCSPAKLAARITAWDAGMGNRTAHVEVTNTDTKACHIRKLDRPQLIDGHGSVIMNGLAPIASTFITITSGGVLKTLVNASNYCGPDPVAPVSVAFIYPGGVGRFVATALSPTDLSGVPPCNGAPGSAGDITMLPWGP